MMLVVRWFGLVIGQTSFMVVISSGWWLSARNASTDDARLFAYLVCYLFLCGAVGWLVTIPLFYRQFAAILRQAEAD
jgi:hypothetical protein